MLLWGRDHRAELAVAGLVLVLLAVLTRHGLLFDPDSATYLHSARAMRIHPVELWRPPSGSSLSIRGLFPPGYPTVLAAVGWATGPVSTDLQAYRVTQCLLGALGAGLLTAIVRRAATTTTAVATVAVVLLQRGFVQVTWGFLFSESLYTTLAIGAVAVAQPLLGRASLRRCAAAGLLAGLAFGTRHVGLGVVLGLAVAVAGLGAGSARDRWRGTALVLAAGLAPMVLWELAISRSGATGPRHLAFPGFGRGELAKLESLTAAFAPRPVLDALGVGGQQVVGALVLAIAVLWSASVVRAARHPDDTGARASALLLAVGWGHALVLLAARVLSERLIALSGRRRPLPRWWLGPQLTW